MTDVDFTNELWLFLSPWCEEAKLDDARYAEAIALAWVALWNYTLDSTSGSMGQIERVCKGLFDIPTEELVDVLKKRRTAFFPDDNRIIERYRVICRTDEFNLYVTFADPNR